MKVDIKSKYKWVGREGFNIRFSLEVWINQYCKLPDVRSFPSSGCPYWEMLEGELCDMVLHSKKEMHEHIKWHDMVLSGTSGGDKR